jgi:hypothetical protein
MSVHFVSQGRVEFDERFVGVKVKWVDTRILRSVLLPKMKESSERAEQEGRGGRGKVVGEVGCCGKREIKGKMKNRETYQIQYLQVSNTSRAVQRQ